MCLKFFKKKIAWLGWNIAAKSNFHTIPRNSEQQSRGRIRTGWRFFISLIFLCLHAVKWHIHLEKVIFCGKRYKGKMNCEYLGAHTMHGLPFCRRTPLTHSLLHTAHMAKHYYYYCYYYYYYYYYYYCYYYY